MANLFGQIDLTELGKLVKTQPNAFKKVQFKDGTTHLFGKIVVKPLRNQTQYKTDFIKLYVKREEEQQGVNYFVGDAVDKDAQQTQQQAPEQNAAPAQATAESAAQAPEASEELPF